MKRLLCYILIIVLILGLCACQKQDKAAAQQQAPQQAEAAFQVGFGRVDITPTDLGHPMGGYGQTDKRLHNNVLDNLYATAIAITGNLAAIIGPLLCKLFRLTDPVAQGVAYGTSGHVVGTSKAAELGDLPAAAGSLSLVIAGILTAVIFPWLTALISS